MYKQSTTNGSAVVAAVLMAGLVLMPAAGSAATITFDDGSGHSGLAEFSLPSSTQLRIVLQNTSSNPASDAPGLLTSLAFDLPGQMSITGGSVTVTEGSKSINFLVGTDPVFVFGGDDVSGEWGYGNSGTTGFDSLVNYVSTNTAGVVPFGGVNLDDTESLNGPQGGLATPDWVHGGLGGIVDSVTFDLNLSGPLDSVSFLDNGAIIEFGSDERFLSSGESIPPTEAVPEPVTAVGVIIAVGVMAMQVRRRLLA